MPRAWLLSSSLLAPTAVFLQTKHKSDISLPWLKLYSIMLYWYIQGTSQSCFCFTLWIHNFYSPILKFCESDKLKHEMPRKVSCYQHILLHIHVLPPGAPFPSPSWIHLTNSYPPRVNFQLTCSRKISLTLSLSFPLTSCHPCRHYSFCYEFVFNN